MLKRYQSLPGEGGLNWEAGTRLEGWVVRMEDTGVHSAFALYF